MSHALVPSLPMLPAAGAAGSLDQYIRAVARIPMLSADEEQALARRLREEDDVEAARTLVMSHLRVVVAIARGYLGYGLPHADLIQEGNIGLMKAVKRFDPARGVRLVSFAVHWIKAEIHEFILKNWRLVKIATTKAQRTLFFKLRGLKKDAATLSPEAVQEVARTLGVKPEEVVEMETRLSGRDLALEGDAEDEDSVHAAPIAWLADADADPAQALEQRERAHLQQHGLRTALAALDARSREIVRRRWLHEEDGAPATLQELAAEYGVSAERIRQIEQKALQKMRTALA